MNPATRLFSITMLIIALCLSGCAAAPGVSDDRSGPETATAFDNFLVLALAESYNNRAHFERSVVSNLKKEGTRATAYFAAAGGNKPIDPDSVQAIMDAGGYDGLLVTRVVATSADARMKSGSAAAKVTRRDGRPFDFFRYKYEEFEDPGALEIRSEATLSVELYRTSDVARVWTTDLSTKGKDDVGLLIDEFAETIVSRLSRAGWVAR